MSYLKVHREINSYFKNNAILILIQKTIFVTPCIILFRDAAMMSMRRMIKGKSPDEIKELQKSDLEQPVSNQDFEAQFLPFNKLH